MENKNIKELDIVRVVRRLEELMMFCSRPCTFDAVPSLKMRTAVADEVKEYTSLINSWADYYSSADYKND